MKYAFIDIDGVTNSSRSVLAKIGRKAWSGEAQEAYEQLQLHYMDEDGNDDLPYGIKQALTTNDPIATALLNRMLTETGALPILSSSHRNDFTRYEKNIVHGSPEHLTLVNWYMRAMGLEHTIVGVTRPYNGDQRGVEINEYVADREIDQYVIIDDGEDFFPGQPLVKIDPKIGFSHADFRECCKILGSEQGMILVVGDLG
jgi:hypothetical protein